MDIRVFPNAGSVAREAAALIAAQARMAIAVRGTFILAVSGGQTPWMMQQVLGAVVKAEAPVRALRSHRSMYRIPFWHRVRRP